MSTTRTPGRATVDATRAWAERFRAEGRSPGAFRVLGRTNLTVSLLGFGGYRVHHRVPEHREALTAAFAAGVNLLDTSSNYTDGGSELLVGEILAEEIAKGSVRREEIVTVSKVGYVQGQNLEIVERARKDRDPFPEVVEYMEGCWHCIHPRFLADQLRRSMERMGLAHLDVYLLHNPEYYFSDLKQRGSLRTPDEIKDAREVFYRRVRDAFEFLHRAVGEGTIGAFGISSNTFGHDADDPEFVSLERCLSIASELGAAGAFAVAQAPLNLYEGGPYLEKNQREGAESFLGLAKEAGIGVLINRPLNAATHRGMLRLADVRREADADVEAKIERALAEINAVEVEFDREMSDWFPDALGTGEERKRPFLWAVQLGESYRGVQGSEHWRQIFSQVVQPQVQGNLQILSRAIARAPNGPDDRDRARRWNEWTERFIKAINDVLHLVGVYQTNRSADVAADVRQRLADAWPDAVPDSVRSASLSRQAIAAVAGLEGVTCVLNGMRTPDYVEDSVGVMRLPDLENVGRVFRAFAAAG
ncbi:MAG: aldo/keto reductase [Myxococcales bacterium]|nr:aldo/keto reductase [Myxococcales bacterium]